MGLRRRSREIALQMLFQNEFAPKGTPAEQLARFAEGFDLEPEALEYAQALIAGIMENRLAIDALIGSHSAHWKTSRMALVDLNVMRIAAFEIQLMQPPVPPSVAINEAVDIAKRYGSSDSGAFVNGILDQVAKSPR
jgi:N utilization substance protein B